MKFLLFACLLLLNDKVALTPLSTLVVEQRGIVVKIVDGDTFDLLTKEKATLRIRMNGIDCPERKQDYYQAAKNALAQFIFNKEVKLVITGRDRNKRIIANVYCDEQNINLAMISSGYAWHYKKYSNDVSYARAENEARLKKKGLWGKENPIAPWIFRKK